MITPTTLSTLKKLRKKGILTIILSTHPHLKKEADIILNKKITHFNLNNLFDEIHTARKYESSKGQTIQRILKRKKIPKKYALMIGDNYIWDYKSAKDKGIDCLLINNTYNKNKNFHKVKSKITKLKDLLLYI